jgi:hypothetical protein
VEKITIIEDGRRKGIVNFLNSDRRVNRTELSGNDRTCRQSQKKLGLVALKMRARCSERLAESVEPGFMLNRRTVNCEFLEVETRIERFIGGRLLWKRPEGQAVFVRDCYLA